MAKKPNLQAEKDTHIFKRWRGSGENTLCALFKYAHDKNDPKVPVLSGGVITQKRGVRINERTGLAEDHFKLPAIDLPKRVYTLMGQGFSDARESFRALKEFDGAVDSLKIELSKMLEKKDFSKHSGKNLRIILENLEPVRSEVYALAEKFDLARTGKDGRLEFDSYKITQKRASAAYAEKAALRLIRTATFS